MLRYAERFDRVELDEETIARHAERDRGRASAPARAEVREAIAFAAGRIRAYHERQRPADARFTDEAGVELGWRWTPLEAVGIYVPGGRAAYPSTVLMNAVPARVAGVERIAMVTPPGRLEPAVLAAAQEAGVTEIWRVGGAQACAALAYRRRADPRRWTRSSAPATPMSPPPSAGSTASSASTPWPARRRSWWWPTAPTIPAWIAADLLSQAEHDPDAQSILITDDAGLRRRRSRRRSSASWRPWRPARTPRRPGATTARW